MMGVFLNNIAFLNPWILLGLGALPALWFLLRVMPPTPRLVVFPAIEFLKGLIPERQTPSHTPWWILLLRLLIAALVLIALAGPIYNPASTLGGDGAVRLVVDNGWASAQVWNEQMRAAEDILARAAREEREVYILTTAPPAGNKTVSTHDPMSAAQAESILKALNPLPWPADYSAATNLLREHSPEKAVQSFWFGHGIDDGGGAENLAKALHDQGVLTYISPAAENLPLLLQAPQESSGDLSIVVRGTENGFDGRPVTVQAMTEAGQIIDRQSDTLSAEKSSLQLSFDIPDTLRHEVTQIRLSTNAGAGGTYILDSNYAQRSVGIVGPSDEAETKPFIEDMYYLTRALEPYSTLHIGSVDNVLAAEPSMIILPDVGAMPSATLSALEDWVKAGGLLLRFAGPNMTEATSQHFLTPLPLRAGGRSTDGSLSWENPPTLAPFDKDSPLYGITFQDDIKVRQQILPESVPDMDGKIWARLDDGTPLISASDLDKGTLVMVHTTASAAWSDLALSGAYVAILKRLVSMSGMKGASHSFTSGNLNPVWVLDGYGRQQAPQNWIKPISAEAFDETAPSVDHPPGLYGRGGIVSALNIGDHTRYLKAMGEMPAGVKSQTYAAQYEMNLMPYVLLAAVGLLLLDWAIMLALMSGLRLLPRAAMVVLALCSINAPAQANDDLKYADGLYLAYIQTGDTALDNMTQTGLENLAYELTRRTSAEPTGVAALNPETDALAFFPLIYWAVSPSQKSLSAQALKNIQDYLDHGGTILFDTRDQNEARGAVSGTQNAQVLRGITQFLNIPPLSPIKDDHVIGRAFYLLDRFPGQYNGGTIWVENNSENGRDGVSSVLIGSNDWISMWATPRGNRGGTGGARQQELAYRFGVNLVMYALTGNYKADQVHVPHILERLGQ